MKEQYEDILRFLNAWKLLNEKHNSRIIKNVDDFIDFENKHLLLNILKDGIIIDKESLSRYVHDKAMQVMHAHQIIEQYHGAHDASINIEKFNEPPPNHGIDFEKMNVMELVKLNSKLTEDLKDLTEVFINFESILLESFESESSNNFKYFLRSQYDSYGCNEIKIFQKFTENKLQYERNLLKIKESFFTVV